MISTAPSVKQALAQRLADDPEIRRGGHVVAHGHPHPVSPPTTAASALIEIRRVRPGDPVGDRGPGHSPAAHGSSGQREERYTIDVVVTVAGNPQNRYAEMEQNAYDAATLVDQSVRAWAETLPKPYDGLARWVLVSSVEDDEALTDQAREASVVVTLAVAARI